MSQSVLVPRRQTGQAVVAGNIIYRQRGTHIHPGLNVGLGSDDTLFALADGVLRYEPAKGGKRKANVYPVESK